MGEKEDNKQQGSRQASYQPAGDPSRQQGIRQASDQPAGTDQPSPDPRDETPPKADKGVPRRPEASANPEQVAGSTGSINMLRTEQLTPAQTARVEGTVVAGASGYNVRGGRDIVQRPR